MITFIKKNTTENPDTGIITYYEYSQEELQALYVAKPSKFIQVTESHAEQVLRPQNRYQEVDIDALTKAIAAISADTAGADRPATGRRITNRKRHSGGNPRNG